MAIDNDEGEMLAKSAANVLAQFDLQPDPKVQAIIGLIMAAGMVYGPRVVMYRARMAQEAQEKSENSAGIYGPDGQPLGTTGFAVVQ